MGKVNNTLGPTPPAGKMVPRSYTAQARRATVYKDGSGNTLTDPDVPFNMGLKTPANTPLPLPSGLTGLGGSTTITPGDYSSDGDGHWSGH